MSTDDFNNELIHEFLLGNAAITLDESFVGENSAALGEGMHPNFASKFQEFCYKNSKVNLIAKPTFYFYFFLGSFYSAPCTGLLEKYDILDMSIKFDEKNHVIKLVYAHDILGRTNLAFKTVVLTAEDPHSLNDLSKYAFTGDEISELVKSFRIDDFSVQKLTFDWKIFKTFKRRPDSGNQFDAAWIDVKNHRIQNVICSILKSKVLAPNTNQFTRLGRKDAEVLEIFNKPFLGTFQPATAEHIRVHAHQIITNIHIVILSDKFLAKISRSGTSEQFTGFITGSVAMNMMKTFGLKIKIGSRNPNGIHSFMMFPNFGSLSGQDTTLSTPIFVQVTANQNALLTISKVLDSKYEERFSSIRYTRNKFATFVVTNFQSEDLNTATHSKIVGINHGILSKLTNNFDQFFLHSNHKFVGQYIENSLQQIFIQMRTRNFDAIAHYLMGQLLTVRSIDSENNADFPKYVLKYEQESLSNDVKSLIMHTKFGVLAVNLIRESNDVYVNQFVNAMERSYMVMDEEPGVFSVMEGLLHVDISFNSDSTDVRIKRNTSPQGSITTFTVQGVLVPYTIPPSFIRELESNRPAEISNRLTKMLYDLSIPQRHIGSFMTGFFSHSHLILPYSSMNTVSLLHIDQNSYVNTLLLQQQASDHIWNTNPEENSPGDRLMVKLWSAHSNIPLPTMKFYVKINNDITNPFEYMEIVDKHHFRYESRTTSGTACPTLHRKKRYLQSDCEPLMDDEKDIFEKDKQSDEISMNSEALLRFVKQNRRAPGKVKQLFDIARKMANIRGAHFLKQVTGAHARQLLEILATTEIPHKLRMIGKWSNRLTMSIMYKNIAVDLYNGNYGGAILGATLLGSGYVVPKAVNFMGSCLKTSEIATKIFRFSAPFLRRFASGFNVYSLVSSIKQYSQRKDNKDIAGIVESGTFLALDVAEISTELAGLESLASITGPVGMAVGAVIFIGAESYIVHENLKFYKQTLHMKLSEQVLEGIYTFIAGDVESSVKRDATEKLENNRLAEQMMKFLNENSQFSNYISQSASPRQDNIINLRSKVELRYARTMPDMGHNLLCFTDETYVWKIYEEHATFFEKFKRGLYSMWNHISKPFQSGKSTFRGFVCENVVGITTGKHGATFINLSRGFDHVDSFDEGDHFYLIGDEFKVINGNNDTDVFVLNGNQTSGYINGYGGDDLVDLSSYAKGISRPLTITVDGYHTSIWTEGVKLNLVNVTNIKGRTAKPDHLNASCSLKTYDSGGSNNNFPDLIHIQDQLCSYDMNLKLYGNSKVDNAARLGKFVYQIELANGSIHFSHSSESYALYDFVFLNVNLTNIEDVLHTGNHLIFAFRTKNNALVIVSVSNITQKNIFHFSDNFTLIVEQSRTLHAFQYSYSKPYLLINNLYPLAQRTSIYIHIRTYSNETIFIGHNSKHIKLNSGHQISHVIENDRDHESFLVGGATSNIFVIKRKENSLTSSTIKVTIFIMHEIFHNTIDLSSFWQKSRPKVEISYFGIELRIKLSSVNDTYLVLIVKNCTEDKLQRLSLLTNSPMKIQGHVKKLSLIPVPFHISSNDQHEFIIEASHIKPGLIVYVDANAECHSFYQHDLNLITLFYNATVDYPIFIFVIKDFYTIQHRDLKLQFTNQLFRIDEMSTRNVPNLMETNDKKFVDMIVEHMETKVKHFPDVLS